MKTVLATDSEASVDGLLAEAEEAARAGKGRQAYELSLQATDLAPSDARAWLLRASLAPSIDERIFCVNRMNELAPGYQDRYNVAFFALQDSLERDPFLAYKEETDHLYRARTTNGLVLSIPKRRSSIQSPATEQTPALTRAQRWLLFALLGLMFAGIGAVIFAPLAAGTALKARQSVQTEADRVDSVVVLVVAAVLFLLGLGFCALLAMHIRG